MFDVGQLSGVASWTGFWFVCNAVCYWWVGAFVTPGVERGRQALRAVSIVHAVIAMAELWETFKLRRQLWPPTIYGASFDTTCVMWYEMAAGYYIWDLLMSLYFQYGTAFVIHGLLSFPVFLFAAIGPRNFLHGFYGRFYHGVFTISTPWLHIRELLIAAKNEDSVWKRFSEYAFAATFIIVRIVLGTFISLKFVMSMTRTLIWEPYFVHSVFAFSVSIISCSLITVLQIYWFLLEIVPAIRAVFFSAKK